MHRVILPVMGALLLCAQSLPALATPTASTASSSLQQEREQIEAKRDQISGAAQLSKSADTGTSTILDAPVATDDAPAQEQQP